MLFYHKFTIPYTCWKNVKGIWSDCQHKLLLSCQPLKHRFISAKTKFDPTPSQHLTLQARDGDLLLFLRSLAIKSLNHINQCQVCMIFIRCHCLSFSIFQLQHCSSSFSIHHHQHDTLSILGLMGS